MNRRDFLAYSGAAAAGGTLALGSFAQKPASVSLNLTLHKDPSARQIPVDFVGFSYELAQLTDPTFFSRENRELLAYFQLLGQNGVLRLGGNTSEFCWFKASETTPAPALRVPAGNLDANWMPHRLFEIRPEAIDALAGFLEATSWQLIYGLNFGNSTPQRAAEEAAYVAAKIGPRLVFFQIGNEPDLYNRANNGTRPADWSFDDYVREWAEFADAISARVPKAHFGAPDVAASSDWITRFSTAVPANLAPRVTALTGHYYAEGPPNDPRVTIERLLAGNPKVAVDTTAIVAAARAGDRIYRMTEGNSCYRGGKPGMSDAFAAALWAGDYMLELASLGCAGVNLHGGRSEFLAAGLGGHTPGMEAAKGPQAVHSGFYTPIRTEPGQPVKAMPVFYGMMLANQFANARVMRTECNLRGVNATVYAGDGGNALKVAIFNKGATTPVDLQIRGLYGARSASVWRLQAPSLDSTEGVKLGGAAITANADWKQRPSKVQITHGVARLHVPAASAALVCLQ